MTLRAVFPVVGPPPPLPPPPALPVPPLLMFRVSGYLFCAGGAGDDVRSAEYSAGVFFSWAQRSK
jgi:hypothetical protein